MILFSSLILLIIALIVFFKFKTEPFVFLIVVLVIILNGGIVAIDYHSQTDCEEVWSGKIVSIEHNEEYDEWIPEEGHTDDEGNYHVDEPAHWEHYNATNYIKTSDNGTMRVYSTLDGKRFTDNFVNSNEELAKYYPIGMPTASVHIYENKVQASYSIYKNREINLEDYDGKLPSYPKINNNKHSINRFVGNIPNKQQVLQSIDKLNTTLNDTNNPNNKSKQKSYKQVNVIYVNMGDVSEDYGFALQDYWKNGNKNDFIITFGSKNNKVTWCHVFSWSEVEALKAEVCDYILDETDLNNFTKTVKDTGKMIEEKFIRKEFADFSYLNIELSGFAKFMIIGFTIIGIIGIVCCKDA